MDDPKDVLLAVIFEPGVPERELLKPQLAAVWASAPAANNKAVRATVRTLRAFRGDGQIVFIHIGYCQ